MGECFIMRHGGSVYRPPLLNVAFPKDVALSVVDGSPESADFTVVVDKAGNPAFYSYQWYIDGVAVDGAVTPNFTLNDITDAAVRNICCEVSNKGGIVVSRQATLYVSRTDSPVLDAAYPADITCEANGSATFEAKIIKHGTTPEYTYQWYMDDVAVESATENVFKVTNPSLGKHRVYCKITSAAGSVDSRTAILNVDTLVLYPVNNSANDVTGGWVSRDAEIDGKIYTSEISRYTVNSIDLTNFSKICFEGKMRNYSDDDDMVGFEVWRYATNGVLRGFITDKCGNNGNFTIDVSRLSGKYYLGYHVASRDVASVNMTKLYLKV